MTISSTIRKAGPYTGNDATTVFPFAFKVFSASDILVVRADDTGAETVLTLNSDYTVSLNANQDSNPGGSVTLPAALASTLTLTITSAVQNLQPTDLTNNGAFFPKVLNTTFDRIVIQIQQLAESLGRSLKTSVSTPDGVDPTLPTPVPYQLIGWNATGTGLQNTDPTYSTALATDLASSSAGKGSKLVRFIQRMTGAVSRWVEDKLSETVSVKDFGAVGDGVANDTAALQAAINSGAKRLHWPAGTYLVGAGGITGVSGQVWVGDGKGRTIIKASAPPGTGADMVFFSGKAGFKITGITFDGNGNLTAGAGHYPSLLPCLHISTCSGFEVSDCEFIGFYNCGLLANVVFDGKLSGNAVTRSAAATFINHGVAVGGGVGGESYRLAVTGNTLTNCQISVNCHDALISGNFVTGWGFSAGINTQADPTSYRLTIVDNICWASNQANDASPYAPAGIENWASDSVIGGNVCYGNFGDGIDNGGARCILQGNVCYNNGGQGIYLLYQDATYNASNCLVADNQLYDTRSGGARTQQAGYKEQSASLTGINVRGNISFNNVGADVFAAVSRNVATQPAWIAPTFANSWSNYGGSTVAAGYYKDSDGIVHLRGTIKGGTLATSAFVLPADMRPSGDAYFATVSNSAFGSILINASGGVIPTTGSTSWFSLEGISFRGA